MAPDSNPLVDALASFKGEEVVVDTSTPYIYLGRLDDFNASCLIIADADVRDSSEGRATKDQYIFEASRHGYRKNRRRVLIRIDHVVSISRLGDVLE